MAHVGGAIKIPYIIIEMFIGSESSIPVPGRVYFITGKTVYNAKNILREFKITKTNKLKTEIILKCFILRKEITCSKLLEGLSVLLRSIPSNTISILLYFHKSINIQKKLKV